MFINFLACILSDVWQWLHEYWKAFKQRPFNSVTSVFCIHVRSQLGKSWAIDWGNSCYFLAMSWYNSELFWQVQIGNLLNAIISRQVYDVVCRSCTKNSLWAKWLEGRNMEQLTSNNIQNYLNYGGWCLFLQYSKYRSLETAWADLWNFSPTLLSSRATMSLVSVSLKKDFQFGALSTRWQQQS